MYVNEEPGRRIKWLPAVLTYNDATSPGKLTFINPYGVSA